MSYEQLAALSDTEIKELLGKGKRKVSQKGEAIDFAPLELELRRKGVTLALLWQEGLDKGAMAAFVGVTTSGGFNRS